ncbi:MAG: hypothetical protein PHI31_13025 [Desulfuromonadaceae bacterium]|nr:hypothetical protein [Desulfuromonadaceae bacterium]
MLTLKFQVNGRKWLIGVPKTMATLWWRMAYRSDTLKSQKVPEHIRSAAMYCPACGKGQPFTDRCTFCGCAFACYVVMETYIPSVGEIPLGAHVSPVYRPESRNSPVLSPLCTLFHMFTSQSSRGRAIAASILLILMIALVIGENYFQRTAQKQFLENFVQAVYGIKSGMALTSVVCEGKYAEWKGEDSSTATQSGGLDSQTVTDLETVENEVDSVMHKMGTPPDAYTESVQILRSMYTLYRKTNQMLVTSEDSLMRCAAETGAANDAFTHEIDQLKARLPAPLAEEFKLSAQKYDLRFMNL